MTRDKLEGRAFLLDLAGTLYEGDVLIPGTVDTLEFLRGRGLAFAYVTNTTSQPASVILERLERLGLPADPDLLFTPARVAAGYLHRQNYRRCHLLMPEQTKEEFAGIEEVNGPGDRPDAVVMGDLGEEFDWRNLNRAFRMLVGGAKLVALARNRNFSQDGMLRLDLGPFVAALEYGANVEAVVMGKPSAAFFDAILEALGVEEPSQAVMVGDDLEADVLGAMAHGLRGVLVKTGKFRPETLRQSTSQPDLVLETFADLLGCL